MTTYYILSQVFIVINYLLIAITYLVKNRKLILIYNFAALIANGISFFFLSAWSGLAMCAVAIIRNIVFLIQNKFDKSEKIKLVDWIILAVLTVISIVSAYFTYEGWLSMLSVFATYLFTISVWQKNTNVYKFMGGAVSILWIAYNIFIKSLFGIICESILFVVEIIAIINIFIQKSKKKRLEEKIEEQTE